MLYNVNRDRYNKLPMEDKTMNKKLTIMALALCFSIVAFGHHHHSGFWGGFTGGLVGGLLRPPPPPVVVAPAPVVTTPVVTTPVVAPAPVVTTTPVVTTVPSYSYGYYNNVYCPTYGGYYYYNNAWAWGGPRFGHRPPPPVWRPHHFHHGPGPGFHHGGPRHHR